MINLKDLTIIIPVKIESQDRYFNLKTVLGYLNHHFRTNVRIIEASSDGPKIDFLKNFKNLHIDYEFQILNHGEAYHRTKYLNQMINKTKTKVIANYDTDVFFPVATYSKVVQDILNDVTDFAYPYFMGEGQKQVCYQGYQSSETPEETDKMHQFLQTFDTKVFNNDPKVQIYGSSYGHCVFASTKKYQQAFGENENFIAYAPEDQERAYRFQKLGYRVMWQETPPIDITDPDYQGFYVYHIEHSRTPDSWESNPHFKSNWDVFNHIKTLTEEELVDYYKGQDYLKKYKF